MALTRRSGAGANQEAVRRHNLGTLLGHVHHDGQVSRADLTTRMGLNRSTIAALVSELEGLGVVEQAVPSGERTGAGRPSLDVRPGAREVSVLAVELRVESIEAARVRLGGDVLSRSSRPLGPDPLPSDVASELASVCRELATEAPDGTAIIGIGVGLPGVVGTDDARIRVPPYIRANEVDLIGLLRKLLGEDLPISIGNDADLGVLSEHTRGAAAGVQNVVYLSADVGVGGGVITGGHTLQGSRGYAGEVGHMRTNPGGRTCRCGSRGCWETEIGAFAIAHALSLETEDITAIAESLRRVAHPTEDLHAVGRHLGIGIANLVNIFNPEAIIVGGILRDLYPLIEEDVTRALSVGALAARQVEVILPGLGGDSVLLGAAELAFGALMRDPLSVLSDVDDVLPRLLATAN